MIHIKILPHSEKGFSLLELMTSLAIFFILGALGIPSYVGYVRNGELSNSATSLFSDLHLARSEAIKRKTTVSLCRSGDSMMDNPTCGGNANSWSDGWIVYVEVDGVQGNFNQAGGDVLLTVGAPPGDNIEVVSNGNADAFINYNSDGSLSLINAPSVYSICVDRDNDGDFEEQTGREIRVNPMGRPEIMAGSIPSCENPA